MRSIGIGLGEVCYDKDLHMVGCLCIRGAYSSVAQATHNSALLYVCSVWQYSQTYLPGGPDSAYCGVMGDDQSRHGETYHSRSHSG